MNDIAVCGAKFSEMEDDDWSQIFEQEENIEVELMETKNIIDDCLEE